MRNSLRRLWRLTSLFENECERVKEQAAYYKRDLENAYERTRELEEQLTEATTAFTKMQEEAGANTENALMLFDTWSFSTLTLFDTWSFST